MYSLRSTKLYKGAAFRRHAWGKTCAARFSIAPSCATEQEIAFLRNLVAPSPSSCGAAALFEYFVYFVVSPSTLAVLNSELQ